MKSDQEIGLRQDSIEYLDRNRAKTIGDRTLLYDSAKLNSSQSGKINELNFSNSRSTIGDYPLLLPEKSGLEYERNYLPTVSSARPSWTTPEKRNLWNYKRPGQVFELDKHKEQ